MTINYLPTPLERTWITRSTAHSMPETMLHPDARWQRGVTDLDVARVMLAIERGTEITQGNGHRWVPPVGSRMGQDVSIIVNEMIRTGLLIHHHTGALVPAKVHHAPDGVHVSTCHTAGEGMGPKRVRLVESLGLVDCLDCLDQL